MASKSSSGSTMASKSSSGSTGSSFVKAGSGSAAGRRNLHLYPGDRGTTTTAPF